MVTEQMLFIADLVVIESILIELLIPIRSGF
jgi:hypothetical protein